MRPRRDPERGMHPLQGIRGLPLENGQGLDGGPKTDGRHQPGRLHPGEDSGDPGRVRDPQDEDHRHGRDGELQAAFPGQCHG